ncbi:MAG TPA: hypothetical protein VF796_26775 [Humisphaera sp.]
MVTEPLDAIETNRFERLVLLAERALPRLGHGTVTLDARTARRVLDELQDLRRRVDALTVESEASKRKIDTAMSALDG